MWDLSRDIVDRGKRGIKTLTVSHMPDTNQKPAAPLFSANLEFSALIFMVGRGGRAWDYPAGEKHVVFTFEKMSKNFSRQAVV